MHIIGFFTLHIFPPYVSPVLAPYLPSLLTFPGFLYRKPKIAFTMNKRCTVCNHPERPEIDRALLHGQPLRRLAAQYGLSPSALSRLFLFSPVQDIWYDYVTRSKPCL